MRVAILQFPGSNCDDDAMHVITKVLGEEASVRLAQGEPPARSDGRSHPPSRRPPEPPQLRWRRKAAAAGRWRAGGAPGRERGVGAGGRLGGARRWARTAGARGWWRRFEFPILSSLGGIRGWTGFPGNPVARARCFSGALLRHPLCCSSLRAAWGRARRGG